MNLFKKRVHYKESADANLVLASIGGDRDAFGEIVGRYQSLLCSLAYSSVGDLKHSEDIAQEAFVEAWRKLETLSDPEKLKAWLCGILRFKISRYRRKETRHAANDASALDEQVADQAPIDDAVIQEQEQALLWKTLEQLPETYREPLILFYREQRSVENVAQELDLTEDTVKQRLSRGRKALQTAMVTFVEDNLSKSKPGASFTMAVLLAISTISAPKAKASVLGMGAGSAFKWAGLLTVLASFSGVIAAFFSVKASLAQSRTYSEKRHTVKIVGLFFGVAIIYTAGLFVFKYLAINSPQYALTYTLLAQGLVFGFCAAYLVLLTYMLRAQPRIRAQARLDNPAAFINEYDKAGSKRRNVISRITLMGVPLYHFKLGITEHGEKPAFGWLAGGDRAYGLLFAWGGLAVAPVSVGIVSVGVVSIGALSVGLLVTGTVAIGALGFGVSAIAYKAYGSMTALGWESAFSGGFAAAFEAALAPIAFAGVTNNEQAAQIVNLSALNQSYLWVLGIISVAVIVPAVLHAKKVQQRMQPQAEK
ncbi:sigma-70 family RNA polymerase sigma factor [Gilvimarinus sp. SDUM040013]|uniref:RNA polymerase sigma factor n=1 Tax=Gilvimarinus gilvus TaxID=3058038 RepID=A0ABU4RZW3_9GAMM|nr:sigma-70 family RNA polymerase sigma factor [Gilvimarinus sp. SDUM040013]MDO3384780.1 sigma-70 family RNA polymerase sigma factor [Gilvimarinus sp. SDUM040013]MDX6850402.1 sigma-70 family RNA polymerase sigma factor [Gilvimarinus sp. SDUM040013]